MLDASLKEYTYYFENYNTATGTAGVSIFNSRYQLLLNPFDTHGQMRLFVTDMDPNCVLSSVSIEVYLDNILVFSNYDANFTDVNTIDFYLTTIPQNTIQIDCLINTNEASLSFNDFYQIPPAPANIKLVSNSTDGKFLKDSVVTINWDAVAEQHIDGYILGLIINDEFVKINNSASEIKDSGRFGLYINKGSTKYSYSINLSDYNVNYKDSIYITLNTYKDMMTYEDYPDTNLLSYVPDTGFSVSDNIIVSTSKNFRIFVRENSNSPFKEADTMFVKSDGVFKEAELAFDIH